MAKLYPHTDPMVAPEPWFLSRSSCHRILNFVFANFFPTGSLYSGLKKTNIPLYQYTNAVVFASYWDKCRRHTQRLHYNKVFFSSFLLILIGTLWHQEIQRFQYEGAEGVILATVGLTWQEITRNCKESQINLIQYQYDKFGSCFQSLIFHVCIFDQFSSRVNIVSACKDAKSHKSKDRIQGYGSMSC